MSRAKAWQEELDPVELDSGFLSYKEDGSPFTTKGFAACVREVHPLASKLAEETNLARYQPAYTEDNSRVKAPVYEVVDLIPPTRKHTFAPEVDPSELIDDEAEFQALTGINWKTSDYQTTDGGKEPAQANAESSTQHEHN